MVEVQVMDDWGSWVHVVMGVFAGMLITRAHGLYVASFVVFFLYQTLTHLNKPWEHRKHGLIGDFAEFSFGVMMGALL